MSTLSEQINYDFFMRYEALDCRLLASFGGVSGYLDALEHLPFLKKRNVSAFEDELASLKRARTLYHRLAKTADPADSIATEDDVDYLGDLLIRLDEQTDPISQANGAPRERNNPDAEKNRPIETESREVATYSLKWQGVLKKIALASAACLAISIGLILKIKKGFQV